MKIKKSAVVSPTTKATTSAKAATSPKGKASKAVAKPGVTAQKQSASEAPAKEKVVAKPSINIGKRGFRIMEFQDLTFAENDAKVRPTLGGPGFRTDEELAQEWRDEYPNSRAVRNGRITADMVRAVRNLYNSGTAGHGTPGVKHESKPYFLDGTKRVAREPERKPRAVAATAKAAAPTAQPAAPAAVARKQAVVVSPKTAKGRLVRKAS